LYQELLDTPRDFLSLKELVGGSLLSLEEAVGAMALEEGKVKIEKFDDRDFSFWKMQIEDYLY